MFNLALEDFERAGTKLCKADGWGSGRQARIKGGLILFHVEKLRHTTIGLDRNNILAYFV